MASHTVSFSNLIGSDSGSSGGGGGSTITPTLTSPLGTPIVISSSFNFVEVGDYVIFSGHAEITEIQDGGGSPVVIPGSSLFTVDVGLPHVPAPGGSAVTFPSAGSGSLGVNFSSSRLVGQVLRVNMSFNGDVDDVTDLTLNFSGIYRKA